MKFYFFAFRLALITSPNLAYDEKIAKTKRIDI
jgi:hypothetical protein